MVECTWARHIYKHCTDLFTKKSCISELLLWYNWNNVEKQNPPIQYYQLFKSHIICLWTIWWLFTVPSIDSHLHLKTLKNGIRQNRQDVIECPECDGFLHTFDRREQNNGLLRNRVYILVYIFLIFPFLDSKCALKCSRLVA